jgi:hypothetical protein
MFNVLEYIKPIKEPTEETVTKPSPGFNPKPHGSGRICPHYFQRRITQKGLKQKNRQKSAIPRKMSAE